MRGIWFLLTVVCVFAIAGIFFLWGRTERFDAELEARVWQIKGTQEYKDAVRKLEEIRAKVTDTADRGAKSLEAALDKLGEEADPKVAQVKADLERLLQELSRELANLKTKADMAARDLELKLARLTTEGRRKAVEGLEWARAQADQLQVQVAQVAARIRTAAVEQGGQAAQALEEQKQNLQKQLESVSALQEKLFPSSEEER